MKSPIYYGVLLILLTGLIVALVLLIRKRRHEEKLIREYQAKMDKLRSEREAEAEKTRKHYNTYNEAEPHIPRYAAGDDMDRLSRPKQLIPTDTLYAILVISLVFCLKLLSRMI